MKIKSIILALVSICANVSLASERDLVAYCIYTEARGETWFGKQAVASVIHNAAAMKGRSYSEEILHPYRYDGVKHIHKSRKVPEWFVTGRIKGNKDLLARAECIFLANQMSYGSYEPIGPWNMFYSGKEPYWDKFLTDTTVIGGHTFGYLKNF